MKHSNKPQTIAAQSSSNKADQPITTPTKPSHDTPQAPAIAPEFVGILGDQCEDMLIDWLQANAPSEVMSLFEFIAFSHRMEIEMHEHAGQVTHDLNASIGDYVFPAINGIAALGGEFHNSSTFSFAREVAQR